MTIQPQIIQAYDPGSHNRDAKKTDVRIAKQGAYKDQSTIIIIPALKTVPIKAVMSWWGLITPPNQKVVKFATMMMEIGAAYTHAIEAILANPDLAKWKYILTIEHDNVPPPDGLVRLIARMEENPEFTAIGGLYFTKGDNGVAQIWGNPLEHPINFKPQRPRLDGGLQECNGTGMGFTLYRLDAFKDARLRRPWFKTPASREEGTFTQDLYFALDAKSKGHRFAIDTSIKVGHYDVENDRMW